MNTGGRDGAWIRLRGNLNERALPELRAALERSITERRLIVVDLRELTAISDEGIAEIERLEVASTQHQARLVLIRSRAASGDLAGLTRLSEAMMVVDTDLDGVDPQTPTLDSMRGH